MAPAQQQNFGSGFTPSSTYALLSPACSGPNCYQANGHARWAGDCTTTSGQNTITSLTAGFTPADGNKHIWCTDEISTDAAYQTTCITGIFTFVSATSGTVSNNATASCAPNGGSITSAAPSGSNTVYTGTFPATNFASTRVFISGMGNANNNGTFTIISSNATTITAFNTFGVTETHAGTATIEQFFLGLGFKDTTTVKSAWLASQQTPGCTQTSVSTENPSCTSVGPPNELYVDCGTYLIDSIPFGATESPSFNPNITFSIEGYAPNCVIFMISDDWNFGLDEGTHGFLHVDAPVTGWGNGFFPPDYLAAQHSGVIRNIKIVGPGLLWASQAGVNWVEVLREADHLEISNLPGPTSSQSFLVNLQWPTSRIVDSTITPGAFNTANPPIAIRMNAVETYAARNMIYQTTGECVLVTTGIYGPRIDHNYCSQQGTTLAAHPGISFAGTSLEYEVAENTELFNGSTQVGISAGASTNGSVFDNLFIMSGSITPTAISNGGVMRAGMNRFYTTTTSPIDVNNSGTFYDTGGNQGISTNVTNTGSWIGNSSAGRTAPVAGNIALGAGYGTSSVTSITGTDEKHFTFTLSLLGTLSLATETITYTFPDAPSTGFGFAVAPGSCRASVVGGTQFAAAAYSFLTTTLPTTASVVFTQQTAGGTAGNTEIISVDCN